MITSLPFGRHKGTPLAKVPAQYLRWLLTLPDLRPDTREAVEFTLHGGQMPLTAEREEEGAVPTPAAPAAPAAAPSGPHWPPPARSIPPPPRPPPPPPFSTPPFSKTCEVCGLADHRPLVSVHAECSDKLGPF